MNLLPWYYRWLAVGAILLAAAAFGAAKMYEHDRVTYDKLDSDFAQYKGEVAAAQIAAQKAAEAQAAADKFAKDKADAEHLKAVAALNLRIAGLRQPAGDFVPAAPTDSRRPDLICFDRAEYQREDGIFVAGARGLADEGSKNTLSLDNAKQWALH